MKINIKKLNKSLITLLLIFTFFAISTYPSSNSKYYLESKASDELNYSVNTLRVKQIDINNIEYLKSQSDETKLKFEFKFDRNTLMLPDDTKDIYTIKVNDGCYITSVNGASKTPNQTQTLEFNNNNSKTDINVKYYCDYTQSDLVNGKYSTDVEIYEQFNSTSSYKYYIHYKSKSGIEPPEVKYWELSDDGMTLMIKKDYVNLESTLVEKLIKPNYEDLTYFSEVYDSVDKMKSDQGLKGLTITTSLDDKYYVYTLDNAYKSYAATRVYTGGKYFFIDDPLNDNDNLSSSLVKEMFDYYLDLTTFTSEEKSSIKAYIKNSKYNGNDGSIYNVINGLQTINGIVYDSSNQYIYFKNIMKYVNSPDKLVINYTDTTRVTDYQNYINSLDILSENSKNSALTTTAIALSIARPSTTSKVDYYYFNNIEDNEKFFVVINSNADDKKILVNIILVESNSNYNLEFYTSDISETDISKVTNVLNNIDSNLTKKVDNSSVESDITYADLINDSNTTMTYTTPNGINVSVIKSGNKINIRFNNTPIVGASSFMAPTFANNAVQSVSSSIDRTTITEEVIEDSNDNIEDEQEVDETSESEEEDDEDKSKVVSSDDEEDNDSGVTQENNDDIIEDGISGNANDGPENVGSDIANNGNSIDINPDAPLDNST